MPQAKQPGRRQGASNAGKPARKGASRKPAARKGGPAAATSRTGDQARPAGPKRGAASGGRAASRASQAVDADVAEHDDALSAAIAVVRDVLSHGVVITGDRLQETMDEAVRRGRMTRIDADELVAVLIEAGRRQTQEALAEIEGLAERSASQPQSRTRSRVRNVAAAARRAPGTGRALRTVDRARRATGLGSSFPVTGYDDLTAGQVKDRLVDLTAAELRRVRDYERRNANRTAVLGAIDKRLG